MGFLKQIKSVFGKSEPNKGGVGPSRALKSQSRKAGRHRDKPVVLDVSTAVRIRLPKQRLGPPKTPERQVSAKYWEIYDKGYSHYRRRWYQKAKDEFLKIHHYQHGGSSYHTHLLRAYRKLVAKAIEKRKFDTALTELQGLFEHCPDYTNTDIKAYNKVVDALSQAKPDTNLPKMELIVDTEPEITVESEHLRQLVDGKKPRGLKIPTPGEGEVSAAKLMELAAYLPESLPYLQFDDSAIRYVQPDHIPAMRLNLGRFADASDGRAFVITSRDLMLSAFDWDLNLLRSRDVSRYAEDHAHLRCVGMTPDLSTFFFTTTDRAYVLDSDFKIEATWELPRNEGWERVDDGAQSTGQDHGLRQSMQVLGLKEYSSTEEVKSAFRQLAHRYHPDVNPDDPHAETRMKEVIAAYEHLTSEEAKYAFRGAEDQEYWVKTIEMYKFEVGGMTVEMGMRIGGDARDWIYGSGISDDGSRLYLGGYSGKTYRVHNGVVDRVYVIPEDKRGTYGQSSPVAGVFERGEYLHILTYWQLYVLKGEQILKHLALDKGELKWFEKGFLHLFKKEVRVYLNSGDLLGVIRTKHPVKHICCKGNRLLIETSRKAYLFAVELSSELSGLDRPAGAEA